MCIIFQMLVGLIKVAPRVIKIEKEEKEIGFWIMEFPNSRTRMDYLFKLLMDLVSIEVCELCLWSLKFIMQLMFYAGASGRML